MQLVEGFNALSEPVHHGKAPLRPDEHIAALKHQRGIDRRARKITAARGTLGIAFFVHAHQAEASHRGDPEHTVLIHRDIADGDAA